MTEYEETILLANRVLDRISGDPDDDLAMLARQFLRLDERLRASHTPRDDVIEECAKVAESFVPNTTIARKNAGKLIATCIRALRELRQ